MDDTARGYLAENYGAPLGLPERGPVGANGYANDRDFQHPEAAYEDLEGEFELICKFAGQLHRAATESLAPGCGGMGRQFGTL